MVGTHAHTVLTVTRPRPRPRMPAEMARVAAAFFAAIMVLAVHPASTLVHSRTRRSVEQQQQQQQQNQAKSTAGSPTIVGAVTEFASKEECEQVRVRHMCTANTEFTGKINIAGCQPAWSKFTSLAQCETARAAAMRALGCQAGSSSECAYLFGTMCMTMEAMPPRFEYTVRGGHGNLSAVVVDTDLSLGAFLQQDLLTVGTSRTP